MQLHITSTTMSHYLLYFRLLRYKFILCQVTNILELICHSRQHSLNKQDHCRTICVKNTTVPIGLSFKFMNTKFNCCLTLTLKFPTLFSLLFSQVIIHTFPLSLKFRPDLSANLIINTFTIDTEFNHSSIRSKLSSSVSTEIVYLVSAFRLFQHSSQDDSIKMQDRLFQISKSSSFWLCTRVQLRKQKTTLDISN